MNQRVWLFAFFIFFNRFVDTNAQIQFEKISIEQGLSHNGVNCICQDRLGFLWFGTLDGLNRYDGYQFVVYYHDPDDPKSLSSDIVYSIFEDRSGVLWIGTEEGGLNQFNREQEEFIRFMHDPNDSTSLSQNFVKVIYEDRKGELWIGTSENGLNKLIRAENKFVRFLHNPNNPNSLSNNAIRSIYEDQAGILWIGTRYGGLNKFDREKETFKCYRHQPGHPNRLSSDCVNFTFEDQRGRFWIGTDLGGLNEFDREKEIFTHYKPEPDNPNSLNDVYVHSIYEDHAGKLWIGTIFGGLNIFDPVTQNWQHIRPVPNNSASLSGAWITQIYKDRSEVLWLGTYTGGLSRFNIYKEKFTHSLNESLFQIIRQLDICSLYADSTGILWLGTGKALHKLDRKKQILTDYQYQNGKWLANNEIWTICDDQRGLLWLGTIKGLYLFDRSQEKIFPFKSPSKSEINLNESWITAICEDEDGMIWLGTARQGLLCFNWQTRQFRVYQPEPDNPHSLSSYFIVVIYEDRSGILWIGTSDRGLNRFDKKTGQFSVFKHNPHNPNSISSNQIKSIFEDQTGRLWIGTGNGGLNRFDRSTGKFKRYTKQEGLPNNDVTAILEDDAGNLWLGTRKGLSKFNPRTETFRNYEMQDGLVGWSFGHALKSQQGEMFFGGGHGFNAFFPDSIIDNPTSPPIVITDLRLFNKSVTIGAEDSPLRKHISECEEIRLAYDQRVFSFEFAALHFGCPSKNQFAYFMEGYDRDWNYIGNRHFASFTNLLPGKYIFRVKGSNCDGIWNETGTSLRIIINPPWWKTWWAYALYLICISGITFGIIYFSIKRTLLKKELALKHEHAAKLEELDRMKSRFFANISHEFRTPLTLIIGPLEKLFGETSDNVLKKQYRVMIRNGQRLLRLINQLLDLSKMEAGKMKLEARPENIVKLVKATVRFFSSWAERKNINLEFHSNEEIIVCYIDPDKLENIVSNLLSNAFKFTPEGGRITVKIFSKPPEWVEIIVSDTGTGIPPERINKIFDRFYQVDDSQTREHEGTGIGLALTKELVELHHGKITAQSRFAEENAASGTTFTVRLPLGKDHFKPGEMVEVPVTESPKSLLIEPEVEESQPEARPATASTASEIILLVEDNPDVREYMKDFLIEYYQIVEAKNGVEGCEKALEMIPDLIISDVMMPQMDGFEFCRKVKTDERTCHIPLILLTARASGECKVEGLETGADDYITKPFDVRELLVRVRNLIDQRRRLREQFSKAIIVKPKEITITSMDEAFLQRAIDIVEKHIAEPEFTTDTFAWEIGVSRMQLNRKLQALTNQSTHEFIRMIRLKRAAQLLAGGAGTVTEIAYDVGFNSLSHFAKAFREQFKQSPSKYAAGHSPETI